MLPFPAFSLGVGKHIVVFVEKNQPIPELFADCDEGIPVLKKNCAALTEVATQLSLHFPGENVSPRKAKKNVEYLRRH